MPGNQLIDNTYYVFVGSGTAIPWPAGARIQQIRLFTTSTLASLEFQVSAGTPWLLWNYITHGAVSVGSAATLIQSYHTIPMGGVRCQTAIIPTTLTACSAWIDFS